MRPAMSENLVRSFVWLFEENTKTQIQNPTLQHVTGRFYATFQKLCVLYLKKKLQRQEFIMRKKWNGACLGTVFFIYVYSIKRQKCRQDKYNADLKCCNIKSSRVQNLCTLVLYKRTLAFHISEKIKKCCKISVRAEVETLITILLKSEVRSWS